MVCILTRCDDARETLSEVVCVLVQLFSAWNGFRGPQVAALARMTGLAQGVISESFFLCGLGSPNTCVAVELHFYEVVLLETLFVWAPAPGWVVATRRPVHVGQAHGSGDPGLGLHLRLQRQLRHECRRHERAR